ncbi:MAG TPA: hypothetical protein DHM44_08850, partial [Flexistipes sinusarabici]|nr:hypothetical protein [Flexistipes sinusarabici]
ELGFSNARLAHLLGKYEPEVEELLVRHCVETVYKRVDTCGAEFESYTPYL